MGCSGGGETIPVGDPTHPVEDLLIGGAVLAWQKAALCEAQRDEAQQDRESESALLLDVAIPALAQALADLDDTTVTGRQTAKDRIGEALTRLHTGRLGMGRGARVMTMRETIATYKRFVESEHARAEAAEARVGRLEEALREWEIRDSDGEPPCSIERNVATSLQIMVAGLTQDQADCIEGFIEHLRAALAGGTPPPGEQDEAEAGAAGSPRPGEGSGGGSGSPSVAWTDTYGRYAVPDEQRYDKA